jgi:hypothetical protein
MCRVVETVLIDQETIYAPRHGNDRLPLGLKGSLNEYELDLLRQRSLSVRYEKVRRGELIVSTPVGFVKAGDRYEKDPDRRVQEAIGLVFAKVLEHDQRSDRVAPAPSAPTIGRKCWQSGVLDSNAILQWADARSGERSDTKVRFTIRSRSAMDRPYARTGLLRLRRQLSH